MKMDRKKVHVVDGMGNKKDVKYLKELYRDFKEAEENIKDIVKELAGYYTDEDKTESIVIDRDYLEQVLDIAKANRCNALTFIVPKEEKPLFVSYHQKNADTEGFSVIAPRVFESDEKKEEHYDNIEKKLIAVKI